MQRKIDVKRLVVWSMYDFANSLVYIAFFLYYSQWLVVDRGVSDFWFNVTFVGSSILFLLTVPVAGSIVDKTRTKMPWLRFATVLSVLFFLLTGVIAVYLPDHYVFSIITFSLASYFYLACFTFYNPLLEEIASPDRRGFASGWGQFGNWLGETAGLLAAIPFVSGAIILFGYSGGRAQALIPASLLFLIFAIPMLFFKEKSVRVPSEIKLRQEYKNAFSDFIKLCKSPGVGLFFLAYFFFNDAIITSSTNFPIYVDRLFGVSDTTKSFVLIGIILTSMIGAPISGWVADKIGFKKALMWVLGGWIVIFPLLAAAHNFIFFVVITVIMGLWFGSIWTVTRAYLLQLTPPEMMNRSFTYYTLMERFATLIGPLSWGLIVTFLPTIDNFNYRMAAVGMAVFVLIGLLVAKRLPQTALSATGSKSV